MYLGFRGNKTHSPSFSALYKQMTTRRYDEKEDACYLIFVDAESNYCITYLGVDMTKKPRITITLDVPTHAILEKFAKLNNTSMSKVVSSFVDDVAPQLEKLIPTLELVAKAKEKAGYKESELRSDLIKSLDASVLSLEDIKDTVTTQFDIFTDEAIKAIKGRNL